MSTTAYLALPLPLPSVQTSELPSAEAISV